MRTVKGVAYNTSFVRMDSSSFVITCPGQSNVTVNTNSVGAFHVTVDTSLGTWSWPDLVIGSMTLEGEN